MPADFKATIRFNPDCKPSEPQHKIACKQLEISEEGSGDLDEMVRDLTDRIREKITDEFRTFPRSVELVGYSMSLEFSVIGPVNRSLAEFEQGYSATIILSDGSEISLDKLTKTAEKVIACARKTGKTVEQVIEEAKAELARQKKSDKGATP